MTFLLKTFLSEHRDAIVTEWVIRLKTQVSSRYSQRHEKELLRTVSDACDSFHHVLTDDNYSKINSFINEITTIRLESGFPLEDVQKAFELYRSIVLPRLIQECPREQLYACLETINKCLAYTIHRFSNHFQKMFNKYLEDYAGQLEVDVKKRTQELRDSEKKYKMLVEGISDGYLVTRGNLISFVNSSFCTMHGYTGIEDVVSRSLQTFVSPESWDKVWNVVENPSHEPSDQVMVEYNRLTRDGQTLPTEITVKRSLYMGRQFSLCICRDITQRVLMEKKFRKSERMAYIGHITASLSHEIRNPLSSIKMNLQILEKKEKMQGNDKRRLEISVNEVKRLERILQELLDFAKPLSLDIQPAHLNTIIQSSIELLDMKFREKQISCSTSLDPLADEAQVDPGKIEQVMINLLLNAADSVGESGSIVVTTRLHRETDWSCAMIRVKDDGKAALPNDLNTIFEPYYTTKSTGIGLGLANVRRIIHAHGGGIHVEKILPKGACFTIILPMGDHHDQNTGY